MKHLVLFSGGIGSWAAAKRVVERHGVADTLLLFCDTLIEDEDSYRFLDEAAANVGAEFVRIADGRTPWQVFHDVRFLGNHLVDPCSKILKRELGDRWIKSRFGPDDVVIYNGMDWTEMHRVERAQKGWAPYRCESPMAEKPYLDKDQMQVWAESEGLKRQRLYEMGFSHANCGGFCVKAGQAHFANLLKVMPERYAEHEAQEEALRAHLGKDVAIMNDRRGGGKRRPLTMKALRERIESAPQMDMGDDWGGCGCFI